jgi:hypothetical protein
MTPTIVWTASVPTGKLRFLTISAAYERFGLNDRQIELVSRARPTCQR